MQDPSHRPFERISKAFQAQNRGTGHTNQGKSRVQDSPKVLVLYPTFGVTALSCTPVLHIEVPEAIQNYFKDNALKDLDNLTVGWLVASSFSIMLFRSPPTQPEVLAFTKRLGTVSEKKFSLLILETLSVPE